MPPYSANYCREALFEDDGQTAGGDEDKGAGGEQRQEQQAQPGWRGSLGSLVQCRPSIFVAAPDQHVL